MMDQVDAIIYELREALAHKPRELLRVLKEALGEQKFRVLCAQMLAAYDARIDARRADLPLRSAELAEGNIEEAKSEEA